MGAGGVKAHEAFSIAPAAPASPPTVTMPTPASPATATGAGVAVSSGTPGVAPAAQLEGVAVAVEEQVGDVAGATAAGPGAGPVDSTALIEVVESEWAARKVLTPIPDELEVGDGVGTAIAVGGADFVDGAATLIALQGAKGTSHEVLTCTLTDDAEQKLLDALAPPDPPMVPVQVETAVAGRLPLDEEHELHEQLARVARSINHHRSNGTAIPQHTRDRLDTVTTQLQQLHADSTADADTAMIAHYTDAAAQCQERLHTDFAKPYADGGKIPMINPYEHHGTATVTKMVPDPDHTAEGLTVVSRPVSRIQPTLNADGTTTWNGTSRSKTSGGTELAVDLGNGYTAVVRPGSMNPPTAGDYSIRNTVEIIAPAGAGHQHDLVAQLGKLNLVNRPMSAAEAEWTYLQRNIYAHQLEHHPAVTEALQHSTGLEDAYEQSLLTQRAHQAVGMSQDDLASFARQLRLDAEADALPDKINLVRDGVATALGLGSGTMMAASDGYRPVPTRTRGWLTWSRIGQTPQHLTKVLKGKALTHRVTGGNIVDVVKSGVLASTERRRTMGVGAGVGMSEGADQKSGGARSVFTRIGNAKAKYHNSGGMLIWDDPATILSRTDWYGYNGDKFGSVVNAGGQTRDPAVAAGFTAGNNEVMIAHGLDLLGVDGPSRIVCGSTLKRDELRSWLTKNGVDTIAGRPINKVVIA